MDKLLTALTAGILEIWAHKTRSFLSFLTMAIGVAALIYTFAITEGQNQRIRKSMLLSGPGRMEITAKRDYKSKGLSIGLTYADALAIRQAFPNLYMVSPENLVWPAFRYKTFKKDYIHILGVTPEWAKRDWVYKLKGRFFSQNDIQQNAKVCILVQPGGWRKKPYWLKFWASANNLGTYLDRHDLLGKTVILGKQSFYVIGILKEPFKEDDPRWMRGGCWEGCALVPLTTLPAVNQYDDGSARSGKIGEIQVDTGQESTLALYKKKIDTLIKARHRTEEDYEIRVYQEIYAERLAEQKKATMSILIMGIICVLAGGIGIMNVTLATIFSRIKEIGIRRALGASKMDILLQFVLEAMLLGFLGGILGIFLGLAGIRWFLKGVQWMEIATFEPIHFAISLLIAAGTGLIFSVYPAYTAAKMDPVEALRYE